MMQISVNQAAERFLNNQETYLLHEDNTESLIENAKDFIKGINSGVGFGYEIKKA
jgi:hypothetical protein